MEKFLYFLAKIFFWAKILSFLGWISISWQSSYFFLAKLLSLGKTYICFWLNFYLLTEPIYLFLAKFLFLNKNYISYWLNFYILAKNLFLLNFYLLLAKLLSLGKTYMFFWLNLYLLCFTCKYCIVLFYFFFF